MTHDVSSRETALAWSKRRIRKIFALVGLAAALAPLASAAVVGWRMYKRYHEIHWGALVGRSVFFAVLGVALIAVVAAVIGRRYWAFAKRVEPIITQGQELRGVVATVTPGNRRAAGVEHYSVTVHVRTPEGRELAAMVEEMQGTPLPAVSPGASATIWILGDHAVVGTSGSLFERT